MVKRVNRTVSDFHKPDFKHGAVERWVEALTKGCYFEKHAAISPQ